MMLSNFKLQELVHPEIFNARGNSCWELIDERVLESLAVLRQVFGPVLVNNWHQGGTFQNRGLRPWNTTTGALYSQHKFGRAMDCSFNKNTAQEVRNYVLLYPEKFPFITCIERDVTWFHFDVRNHNQPLKVWQVAAT